MLSRTSAVSFSISSGLNATLVVLPLASVTDRWFTTTAAFRRLMLPLALRVTRTVLSTSYIVEASRRVLPAPAPACAACSGCEAPVSGAVAASGGWFDAAPGTPVGVAAALPCCSLVAWLLIATVASAPWFGLKASEVASLCVKSTSAVTLARRLSRPTIGSSSSKIRLA